MFAQTLRFNFEYVFPHFLARENIFPNFCSNILRFPSNLRISKALSSTMVINYCELDRTMRHRNTFERNFRHLKRTTATKFDELANVCISERVERM